MNYRDVVDNLLNEIGFYADDPEMYGRKNYLEFKETTITEFSRIENVIRDCLSEGFDVELKLSLAAHRSGGITPIPILRVHVNNDMIGVFFDMRMDGSYRYFTVYSKADTGNPIDSPVSGAELFGLVKRYLCFNPIKALNEIDPLSILGNTRALFGKLK